MRVILIAAAALVCGCWGCVNPFAPKLGETVNADLCTDLTVVDNIFCAFSNAYTFKDTTLYGSLLSDDFTFVYTDYEHGVDVAWGREEEMHTAYGLFQNVQSLMLVWNHMLTSEGNDTVWTAVRSFSLSVTFNPSDVTRVDGYANLTLRRGAAGERWSIARWRDESNY